MSLLNITDLDEIDMMTLREYNYRMYAYEYSMLQKEFERYKLAFAIRDAALTKNVGTDKEPKEVFVFKTPNDILNYEENVERLNQGKSIRFAHEMDDLEPNQQESELLKIIAQINNGGN